MNELMANFSQFHFLRPDFFYLLILLALFWWLKVKVDDSTQWHQVLPAHLAKVLLATPQQKSKQNRWLIPVLWLLAVTALAGPTWQKIEKPVFQIKRASVIVMDMSMSMRATDIKPNRLSKAKYKAIDLAKAIPDGEIALVAYAGDAFAISPLTPDSKNIVNLIPSLSPEIMPEAGSYPLSGLTKASELLHQAGFVKGDIYWLTDGIEQEEVAELNRYIGQSRYTFHVLAFGTTEGAPIQMLDKSLLKDQFGSIVIPKLNAPQLAQMATVGRGVFVKSTASGLDVQTLLNANSFNKGEEIQQQDEQEEDKLLTGDDWQEAGPYLILVLLPFVLYAFRRGVVLSLCLPLLLINSEHASADEQATQSTQQVQPSTWQDFVFDTKDQVATKAYSQGEYAQAQATFENAQWKGAAAYKAGDYETALNLFEQDNSATGKFNQANALAHLGKTDDAIKALDEVLKQQPDHAEALANKALLEQIKQQEQQQEQQNGEQQQDGEQQDNEGGQQQDQSDQKNAEQEQNSDQQGEQEQSSQSENGDQNPDNQSPSPQPTNQEQENKQNEPSSSDSSDASDKEQAPDAEEQKQQAEAAQQDAEQQDGNQQAQAAELTPEQLAEQEQQQKLEQLLRKVSDDPSVLLRNKMILESRKRQQFGRPPKGAVKSW